MKKAKKNPAHSPSIKTAIVFGSLVIVVVGIALCVKVISTIHDSTYDGVHRYTVAFRKDTTSADIVTFEKSTNTIALMHITGKEPVWPLEKTVGIPVDAIIFASSPNTNSLTADLLKRIFSVSRESNNMTSYDVLRLASFAHAIPPAKVNTETITWNGEDTGKDIGRMLLDSGINQENVSITITNASGIAGLGASLDKVLTAMGGNVIMVNSQEQPLDHTTLSYSGKKTYTLEKLAALLRRTPRSGNSSGISDILITIGRDGYIPDLPQNKP